MESPGADRSKGLVERLFSEVFNEQRWEVAQEVVAENYVEHAREPFGEAEPGTVHGPSHQREVVEWLRSQFPDLRMTILALAADGDLVVARVLSEGTNLGPLGGVVPATGKRFRAEQSHWYRVEDERLCEHWANRDDLSAMTQLGVVRRGGPPD